MKPTLLVSWIHSYGLMLAVGFYAGWWLAARRATQQGEGPDAHGGKDLVGDLVLLSILFGVGGARILWFVLDASPKEPWWMIFKVWEGGLVFYGGLITAGIADAFYLWRRKVDLWKMADILAPAIAIGQAFGRLGCFLNGCCYGGVCTESFPLGLRFPALFSKTGVPEGSPPFLDHLDHRWLTDAAGSSLPIHPTQLYASLSLFAIAALVVAATPYKRRHGELVAMVVALNALSRLGIELVRRDTGPVMLGLTAGQLAASVLLLAGVALFAWARLKGRPAH